MSSPKRSQQPGAPRRVAPAALPVLEGLHLSVHGDELAVTGTDLEMSIRLTTTVGGVSDGAVVVPARLSADAVKSLPAGAVEFSSGDDEVTISAGRSQFSLRSYNIDDYPAQVDPAAEAVTLSSSAFADALRQVVRAASTDEARGVITGVLIAAEEDSVRMVATDSYRLAVRDLPETGILAGGQKVLVPHRALTELQRILGSSAELTVRLGARHATFECGHSRLTTRLIEGEYPNYRNLVPGVELERPHREQGSDCSSRSAASRSWRSATRRPPSASTSVGTR